MKNLIKADLYRARKDKVLLIGLIVSVGLVILSLLLTKVLQQLTKDDVAEAQMFFTTSGLSAWSNGVSVMGNTAQMIAPIFITIFFVKEFNDRTIRNKLIIGYSRSQIFFSIIIVHLILSFVYLFAASIVGLALGSLLFGLGLHTSDVLLLIIFGFILQFILSYVLMGFCIILSINKQNLALGIVLPIAIGTIISLLGAFAITGASEGFSKVMSFTNFFQSQELQNMISAEELVMTSYLTYKDTSFALPLTPLTRILITAPILITLELVIGYFRFKKIQFK